VTAAHRHHQEDLADLAGAEPLELTLPLMSVTVAG
jgi:hypothetical protein